MRIARFEIDNAIRYGIIENDTILEMSADPWNGIELSGRGYNMQTVRLLAPVEPPDIFAIGRNYRAHADETGSEYPEAPLVFIKASGSVVGPGDDIRLPETVPNEVDYEAELAVVIGKTCSKVKESEALDYVLGYTCGNDVSARDCQFKYDKQWARAKSFDTFCPLGPWIETEIDPRNTGVALRLNGVTMQNSDTSNLIFSCAALVSYLSHISTLKPGTVIMTGTPEGVGYARKPEVYLKAGDVVEVEINGVGTLRNKVTAG